VKKEKEVGEPISITMREGEAEFRNAVCHSFDLID